MSVHPFPLKQQITMRNYNKSWRKKRRNKNKFREIKERINSTLINGLHPPFKPVQFILHRVLVNQLELRTCRIENKEEHRTVRLAFIHESISALRSTVTTLEKIKKELS